MSFHDFDLIFSSSIEDRDPRLRLPLVTNSSYSDIHASSVTLNDDRAAHSISKSSSFESTIRNLGGNPICEFAPPSAEELDICFHIIRNVLSMLNGLNVETIKKNPNDIFMMLKQQGIGAGKGSASSVAANYQLDDESCQLIIRIGGLGKLLLKIISYLNYYHQDGNDHNAVNTKTTNNDSLGGDDNHRGYNRAKMATKLNWSKSSTTTMTTIKNATGSTGSASGSSGVAYPMFDEDMPMSGGGTKTTLGNIRQYFVSSMYAEIKQYHYHLLMIEAKFRANSSTLLYPYQAALRKILLWSAEWLQKFLFISESLKRCVDLRGVALLNATHDASHHGSARLRRLGRTILHQTLKPFIFSMFDWLQSGEVSREIAADFFIQIKDKSQSRIEAIEQHEYGDDFEYCSNLAAATGTGNASTVQSGGSEVETGSGSESGSSSSPSATNANDEFEWKLYELNRSQLPAFMSPLTIKKIYFIGNAVRLLRYMLREEYDARMIQDIFAHSQIAYAYEAMKKFVYKSLDRFGSSGELALDPSGTCAGAGGASVIDFSAAETGIDEAKFFFEHPLVDEFDLLLDAYYEVVNEHTFRLLNMAELRAQFESQLGYVLMQRGDFYESLIGYLAPLLRKPATEVANIVTGQCTSLHRLFNMFMVNAKLIELAAVYKIDSLLYHNYDINEQQMMFTFVKQPPPMQHHLGWDIFVARYRFTKKVYQIIFSGTSFRYERLFRQLFHFRRVIFAIRVAQRQIAYYQHRFRRRAKFDRTKMAASIGTMLNMIHFLLFHMFGFVSRMYQHFGSQIASAWSSAFEFEFERRQKNVEKFTRAHERFLATIESIVFFDADQSMIAAFAAVNDAILHFADNFAESELFPTLDGVIAKSKSNTNLDDCLDFEALQTVAEDLFRHQFKISINISKYRCCISHFIALSSSAHSGNFDFKYDILNYQPCLDKLFSCCHSARSKS